MKQNTKEQNGNQFTELLARVEDLKRSGTVDLSTEEDLSVGIMNLLSIEEHLFFTGVKLKNGAYFDMLGEIRGMRKTLLERLIPKHEGETWCISKHLLAATMRLIEVGTKLHRDGKAADAESLFTYANRLFTLFWGLRLKLLSPSELKKTVKDERPWTLDDIMNKLVDCCDE